MYPFRDRPPIELCRLWLEPSAAGPLPFPEECAENMCCANIELRMIHIQGSVGQEPSDNTIAFCKPWQKSLTLGAEHQ